MNAHQKMVREFHNVFGLTVNETPTVPSPKDLSLRVNLINEEAKEYDAETLKLKIDGGDNRPVLENMAKELADILYVVYGAANTLGIDMEPVFAEVHRSNMSKVWPDGTVHRRPEDGKVLKPSTYSPADIKRVFDDLLALRQKMVKTVQAQCVRQISPVDINDAKNIFSARKEKDDQKN